MTELREGIAANLEPLKAAGWQVGAYVLANATPPSVHVMPGDVTYHRASRDGLDDVEMKVQAFVALSSDRGAQARLDALLAPTGAVSVKALIEADKTLGGLQVCAWVKEASGYQVAVPEGKGPVLMVEWTVAVMASN